MKRTVKIGGIPVGGGNPLVLIAGPCVIESLEVARQAAAELKRIAAALSLPLVYKSSFDKANRTSIDSYRGPGLEKGLEILAGIKAEFDLPIVSDVHTPEEAAMAAGVLDCLQIPAFLCRQTDLLVAAGKTGKPVNIKKGQFLAPEDMENAAAKVESGGDGGVLFTERGSTFGYRYLVVDFMGMARMAKSGRPIVFDATHAVQSPGGGCGVSSGDRELAPLLARGAAGVGIDALFLEVHPDPDNALCDGPNSIALSRLEEVLKPILAIDKARRENT